MDSRPIFYDASGRRRRRFALAIAAFALLLLLSAAAIIGSLVPVAPQPPQP